jgi:predicted nucleic acid-binding protein
VREAVLDASVVLNWFAPGQGVAGTSDRPESAETSRAAHGLRGEFESGELLVVVPPLLFLEIVNVAGRRWAWPTPALIQLASSLEALSFDVIDPDLGGVARWVGSGLSAYDAAYVALAEANRLPLLTSDRQILAIAAKVAKPIARRRPGR